MKKAIFLIIGWMLVFSTSQAQEKYGIRTGLNVANMTESFDNELDNPIPRVAWFVGFTADYRLVKHSLYFQPGLLFNKKGFLLNDYNTNTRSVTSLNYLDVPLNLVLKFGSEKRRTRFFLVGGGYAAMGLGGKTKVRVNGQKTEEFNVRFDKTVQRFDYGFNAGLGLEFEYAQLGVFYTQGLRNLSEDGSTDARNRVFGVTFGYLFDSLF